MLFHWSYSQFKLLHLGEEDIIIVHNGEDALGDILVTLNKDSDPIVVTSAGNHLYIYMHTSKESHGQGFLANYKLGMFLMTLISLRN